MQIIFHPFGKEIIIWKMEKIY